MKKYLFISLIAIASVSCAMEEIAGVGEADDRVTTINVSLSQTKVSVDEADGKCFWEEGDCIAVWDASASSYVEFTLTEGAGGSEAVFSASGIVNLTDGADMFYPASYAYSFTGDGEPVLNIPNVFSHDAEAGVPVVLRGNVSLNGNVPYGTFSHEMGIIKFTLHDVPAYAAGFVMKSETMPVAGLYQKGEYTESYSSKAMKVAFPYKTGYNYSTEDDGDADPDDAVLYVALPDGSYSDLSVYFIDGDGDIIEGTQKNMKSATLAAGDYVVMPVLDLKKSQLRKDYVKVCGVKWAKGNLVFDNSSSYQKSQPGVDDAFQTGWGLHDEQWKYINWDKTKNTAEGKYTNDKNLFDHFNYGGIGRRSRFGSVYILPSGKAYSIAGKVYKGADKAIIGADPCKLEVLTDDNQFTNITDFLNGDVIVDGKELGGDIAYWASKGKYCLPTSTHLSNLSHKSNSKASFQFGHYKPSGSDVTIYGVLYTTPQGEVTRNYEDVEFTEADIESGLFLPKAGRRGPKKGHSTTANSGDVIEQGTLGVYRCATFGSLGEEFPYAKENTTVLELNGNNEVGYGYSFPADSYNIYSSSAKTEVIDHKYSVRAGLSIRPVLVDDTEPVPGDVAPLPVTPFDAAVGQPLPAWREGCLDIHAINSGRGECTFFIMPDGTSLCVDAGELPPTGGEHPRVDAKPDADTRAYMVYANYIKHFLPTGDSSLDYMLMTHFHNDHFGTTNALSDYPLVTRGSYKYPLTGIMALYDEVPFDKIIDRAYDKDSDYNTTVPATGQDYSVGYGYYGQFVDWASGSNRLVPERAVNGSTSQLALVNNPSLYPDFQIQINAVNGTYWDGTKSVDPYSVNRAFGKQPGENANSISFLLSYGEFDYLTSGDAGANTYIEDKLAKAIGRKIEAMKAHHHFSWNTMSSTSMAIYQPTVVVSQSFYDHQPDMGHSWTCNDSGENYAAESTQAFQTAWGAYPGEKHWFFTNIHPTTAKNYPYEVAKMAASSGHVVIRVAKNAEFYYVYVLDDTDSQYRVRQINGPYTCHQD